MTSSARHDPLREGTDTLVPRLELSLDGRALGQDVLADVLEVVLRDDLDELGSVELRLRDWDAELRDYRYSNADELLFLPGRRLTVALGFQDDRGVTQVFDGHLQAFGMDAEPDHAPSARVLALDALHDLRQEQRSQVYQDVTDLDVAREIAGRLGLELVVDVADTTPVKHPYLVQEARYDILFLRERARALGADLFLDRPEGGGAPRLRLAPTQLVDPPEYSLVFGRTLHSFQVLLDCSRQVAEVVVRGWDAQAGQLIEGVSTSPRTSGLPASDASRLTQAFAGRREVLVGRSLADQAEALSLAAGLHDDIARRACLARGECLGLPRLRAGTRLLLDGLGRRFSGAYTVTASEQRLGRDGYRTSFEARLEESA